MSTPQRPSPAKLIIGLLMKETSLFAETAASLEARFGAPDMVSAWLPFDFTAYYENEMGAPLKRRLISFARPIDPGALPEIKLFTNEVEAGLAAGGRRRVNIDPGYLTMERFILATCKNFTHRVYLARGIYADLTLLFTGGRFVPLDWTYPDYATAPIRDFLTEARQHHRERLRGRPAAGGGDTADAGREVP